MTQPASVTARACPIGIAKLGVLRLHRHHKPPVGALVAFEVVDAGGWPRGWATVGRPVSRVLQEQGWVEVTRVAVEERVGNACSALYGAAARWARRKGQPVTTYTLATESGVSLRAAGWIPWAVVRGQKWTRSGRRRRSSPGTEGAKIRWVPRWAAIGPALNWPAIVHGFDAGDRVTRAGTERGQKGPCLDDPSVPAVSESAGLNGIRSGESTPKGSAHE